ncbi:MAG: N-acetylmuramoyl-L-alanine amidase [Actinobacteria bacterium]|nr:N-acetylmuramoyl-L-alanine amidase [Actinomycetota bacterium]
MASRAPGGRHGGLLAGIGAVCLALLVALVGSAASAATAPTLEATTAPMATAAAAPTATPPPKPPIVAALMANATRPQYLADMRAYSWRHYGIDSNVLNPEAVVLHFTTTDAGSWRGLINWWDQVAASGANSGGEQPMPAAHFIIEQDGTIYQTMPTDLMVRHTYGLNHRAIGIEFVERSSATNIMRRQAQIQAGFALVRWLQFEYRIPSVNIVGHGTANSHPLFFDRLGLRNDHTDWNAWEVGMFRYWLGPVAMRPYDVGAVFAARYNQPGVAAAIGAPTSSELPGVRPGERMQRFQRGMMHWSASTGAWEVYGGIGDRYRVLAGPNSPLGLPTSGERNGLLPGSRTNSFQGGVILWSPTTGAHDVYGAIGVRYRTLGSEAGVLGLPTSGETAGPVPGSRANTFTNGVILWSPATGAREITGTIGNAYRGLPGQVRSVLGLPRAAEEQAAVPGARKVQFAGGAMYTSPTTGTHVVYGAIAFWYFVFGGESGSMGLPVSDEYAIPGGRASDFQGGRITWNATTGKVTFLPTR